MNRRSIICVIQSKISSQSHFRSITPPDQMSGRQFARPVPGLSRVPAPPPTRHLTASDAVSIL